jgi:hypothetical protein
MFFPSMNIVQYEIELDLLDVWTLIWRSKTLPLIKTFPFEDSREETI